MKMFTTDGYAELFWLKVSKGESLYTCDYSSMNNKYLAGGKNGNLYYLSEHRGI